MSEQNEPSQELRSLIVAIQGQTQAIQALADSNAALIKAMCDVDEDDLPAPQYLDGSPCQ